MAREIAAGSTADRILRVLAERWPVTLDEVQGILRLSEATVRFEVKRLTAQGLVTTQTLPGDATGPKRTYATLSGKGARVVGLSPAEAERRRKASRLPPAKRADPDDPAFG